MVRTFIVRKSASVYIWLQHPGKVFEGFMELRCNSPSGVETFDYSTPLASGENGGIRQAEDSVLTCQR